MNYDDLYAFVGQHTALSEADTEALCEKARRPDYWLSLCKGSACEGMTISTTRPPVAYEHGQPPDLSGVIADYHEFGHCAVHEAFSTPDIERLAAAVMRVHEAGWPMIYAFVFDQFWSIFQSPKLHAFAHALLGPGFQPTISFWVNYVPARRGRSGFPPHLDNVRPGFHSVNCWLPLTPATTDNGCVYIVEQNPESQLAVERLDAPTIETRDVRRNLLLQVRALPANPGSFLAWPHSTLHWGGMYLRGGARLALSYHLTEADFDNVDRSLRTSLVPGAPLPTFERRLKWASASMMRFRTRDPLLQRFASVAVALIKTPRSAWPDSDGADEVETRVDAQLTS